MSLLVLAGACLLAAACGVGDMPTAPSTPAAGATGAVVQDTSRRDDPPSPSPSPTPRPSPSATPRPSPTPDDDNEDEVEFRGGVESVTPPDLRVAGRAVHTDGNTRILRKDQRIGLSDLKVGATVEVDGVRRADGTVLARKIKLEDGENDDDDDE
jgi:hypothetical protein